MANNQTKNIIIAQRYADSLVELVQDSKLTYEKISLDLNVILQTLKSSSDLVNFLSNPQVSADDKKEVVVRVFEKEVDSLMLNFMKVLIDKNRFSQFETIVEAYNQVLDKVNNLSRVKVTSAVDLSEDAKKRLKEKLENKLNKKVAFDWEINPTIIAGLVIQMGDNVIDTSLKHKLEDLSKSITK